MDLDTSHIDKSRLPQHIAIIMDGNGRWAKKTGKPRVFGHRNGVKSVREVTEAAAEIGIKYITLYAFSKENWNRPSFEVNTLMKLFVQTVSRELDTLNKNNIRLEAIGDMESLPAKTAEALRYAIDSTAGNHHMTLILALNYSSRWEITEAVKAIAKDFKEGKISSETSITEETINQYLQTKNYPDPELMIRTSGEQRISNYLLWQLSYAELIFLEILWPDFRKQDLCDAIAQYQQRERRFGMTGEQVNKAVT
jgi:undecaprenyl diphosphate synthase